MASFARAVAVLGVVSVIGTATQVAKGKLGAVLLGAAGVGVLNQLTTLYSLLFMVAGLGFFSGILRQITLAVKEGGASNARAQINSIMLFLGVVSLVLTAGGMLLSPWISHLLFADGGQRSAYVALIVLAVPIAVQQRIFRAFLNATKQLKAIARSQMAADVSSVAVFAIGAWQFGLWGAIYAFIAMHVLLLAGTIFYSVRTAGIAIALPHPRHFHWTEVTANFGYGLNALLISFAVSGAGLLVGRLIITSYGLAEAGVFAVAYKVATVYLGAIYAAAGNYYFPTLVEIDQREKLEEEANRAVALYMSILPPLMLGLIATGDVLIPLLFSSEFLPAVSVMTGLLLGDVFRVASETMGLTMLARRKLVAYNAMQLLYAAGFLALTWLLLPTYGLLGIAYAYIAMRALGFLAVLHSCRLTLDIGLSRHAIAPTVLAILAVAPMFGAELLQVPVAWKFALGIVIGVAWLALSWNLAEFSHLRELALKRLRKA